MRWRRWAGLVAVGVLGAVGFVGWGAITWDQALAHGGTLYPDLAATTDPAMVERGRYLVRGPAHCSQCHSEPDRSRPERVATAPLTGGLEFAMGPLGSLYARNLTPDPETGIGRRTDAELARVLRTGVLPDGQLSVFMRYSASVLHANWGLDAEQAWRTVVVALRAFLDHVAQHPEAFTEDP